MCRNPEALKILYPQFYDESPLNLSLSRDHRLLTEILNTIDIEANDSLLWRSPKSIKARFVEAPDYYNPVRNNSTFILKDQTLIEKLYVWLDKWDEIANLVHSGRYNYRPETDSFIFHMPGDLFLNDEDDELYKKIQSLIDQFRDLQNEFCIYVDKHYPTIDLKNSSEVARKLQNLY